MIPAFIVLLVVAVAFGGYIAFMILRDRKKAALPAAVETEVETDGKAEDGETEEIDIVFEAQDDD